MEALLKQLIVSQQELVAQLRAQTDAINQLAVAVIDLAQQQADDFEEDVPRLLDGSPAR